MSEDTDNDLPEYTINLNGKVYELNKDARDAIRKRAEHEYEGNEMFSAWWTVADPEDYTDEGWENSIHAKGDPVLVIETEGTMVPWDKLDQLNVEMQEVGPQSQLDNMSQGGGQKQDQDNGNGLKTLDPDGGDVSDASRIVGRTHFGITPQNFEEVPSPDGEDDDKIPPKPVELGDDPKMVYWVPNHPDVEHTWSAGEAITSMYNRVEWNVQKRANQPRLTVDKDNSHDLWESMLQGRECDVVAKLSPTQKPGASSQKDSDDTVEDMGPKRRDGKAGWTV